MVYLRVDLEDTMLGGCLAGEKGALESAENRRIEAWRALAGSCGMPFRIYVKRGRKLYDFIYMDDRDRLVFMCDGDNMPRNDRMLAFPVDNAPKVYIPAMLAMDKGDGFLTYGSANRCSGMAIAGSLGFKGLDAIDENGYTRSFTLADMPHIVPISLMEHGWAPLDCFDETDRKGVYVVTDFDKFWPEDYSFCYMEYREGENDGEFRERAAGEFETDCRTLYFISIENWLGFAKKMESEGFMCI